MADEKLGEGLPAADEAFIVKKPTTLKDLQGSIPEGGFTDQEIADAKVKLKDFASDLDDALPPPPLTVRGKPFPSGKILGYVSLAVNKKFGEKLTDEECDRMGLPHGSVMPHPDDLLSLDPLHPGVPVQATPQNSGGAEVPPFTLDPEAELPGEEDIDHKGSTPAHHTERPEVPLEGPRPTRTVDEVADEAKAVFDAMLDRGFSRAESLELVKEVVKVRAKE
jgi:hypothetical protein